ncbi:conjugal transfer protein TraN [Campylobacter lari]|nr:conjugal transfer protein TraN [Campylobacter lari]MCV3421385.1 conjugal transfer protein TraN [Campylobacter lari]
MKYNTLSKLFYKDTLIDFFKIKMNFLKFTVILSMSFSFSQAGIQCTDYNDFRKFGNHYYTVSVKKLTFLDAQALAEKSGGYLAIPNTKDENNFITSLVKGGEYAWIGIYDPDYTSNYCKEGNVGCFYDDSRFKTVKNSSLTYRNWADKQPDNLLKQYDIVDDKERVSPLGEHWVALASPSGEWADFGNHFGDMNNPIKHYAVYEFDSMPPCYDKPTPDPEDPILSGLFCNSAISDDPNFKPENIGKSEACLQDSTKQNYFCPLQLTKCVDKEHTIDGGSEKVEGGQIRTGIQKVTLKFSSGHVGHNSWKVIESDIFIKDIKEIDSFKLSYAGADDWVAVFAPNSFVGVVDNYPYVNGVKDDGKALVYIPYRPDYYGELSKYSGKSLNIELKQYLKNGLNKGVAFFATVGTGSWNVTYEAYGKNIECADFGKTTCTQEEVIIPYSTYKYTCPSGYTPKDEGGNCHPTSTDDLIDTDGDGIGDSCNSSIPPANNCVKSRKVCPFNEERECVLTDNKYQCSPFPCIEGASDIEDEDTQVGINDENNNGWEDDGSCGGQIFIFNGKDNRCRSKDKFFGLTGGGCCDKDKVFIGLVPCKEDEKKLAKLNKQNRCVEVGEYCSKKIKFIGCIQHKKTHCCFNSKLARIFNEQGRPQIGRGWGSPKSPDCRGFTPEEFQKLDFSEIDLSEFIADIVGSIDVDKIQADSIKIQEKIESNLENLTRKPTN